MKERSFLNEVGAGLLELIASLGLASIVMGWGAANLSSLEDPLQDSSSALVGFLKQNRARAVSTTSAYRVYPASSTSIVVESAISCNSAVFQPEPTLSLTLPLGAFLQDTTWSVCFSSRGLADSSPYIDLADGLGRVKSVEVYLGGAVRLV